MIFFWTDEAVATLRKLWTEGVSTKEIGRQLGCGKNAAVGKAHRLNLARRRAAVNPAAMQARLHARLALQAAADRGERGVEFMALESGMCRWPITSGKPHRFCGCPTEELASYCAEHAAMAYVAPLHDRILPPREYNIINAQAA
jgi:hypothetical protein